MDTGLSALRQALVVRANEYKKLCDTLRDSREPISREAWLRARSSRVALWGAIKLVDELAETGTVRSADEGGHDGISGLIEMIRSEQRDGPDDPTSGAYKITTGHDIVQLMSKIGLANSISEAAVCLKLGDIRMDPPLHDSEDSRVPWGAYVDPTLLDGRRFARYSAEGKLVRGPVEIRYAPCTCGSRPDEIGGAAHKPGCPAGAS